MSDQIALTFEFDDNGRTFVCTAEPRQRSQDDQWWWFHVSNERHQQRYAPFRKERGDTRANVQARILAYFDDLVARRLRPPTSTYSRGPGRPRATPQPAELALTEVSETTR